MRNIIYFFETTSDSSPSRIGRQYKLPYKNNSFHIDSLKPYYNYYFRAERD